MKATLTFNLNEQDDQLAHLQAIKAQALALALWEIWNNSIREVERKIDNDLLKEPYDVLDEVRNNIASVLESNDIVIDNLII